MNIVTADLFAKYPTAYDLAQATQKQVEKIVKSAGFYRAKAKNIRNCAKQLMEKHDGEIPLELEALTVAL